ncbi:dual 3',5'-cyclic-AMP and -GMP phosphodiesterase 11 [Clonorchis sinensis]|uniref:Phosphodiesterase n=1 Tax=Clonorchis sinensis TaxID=79923 RepID=G7Y619_CLOSI|nr:dual 3',5'-cyclic-AMP and -GMP phosphodiesterase 11 [Clonorchis sinensis]
MRDCVCQLCGNKFASEDPFCFHEALTKWLDNNPSFTWSYFNQKAVASASDSWFPLDNTVTDSVLRQNDETSSPSVISVSSAPSISPSMCKISSHDFDFHDFRRILSSSEDGQPTFMPPDFCVRPSLNYTLRASTGNIDVSSIHRPEKRPSLTMSDERELINELIMDVCRELNLSCLCFKILQNVCILVKADRGSLFLVDRDRLTGEKVLVSKLFDVTPDCSFKEVLHRSEKRRVTIPMGIGISGHVAQTGDYANIPDAYADSRFSDSVDRETGYRTKCILCMPIKDIDGEVLAVALLMNKKPAEKGPESSLQRPSAVSVEDQKQTASSASGTLSVSGTSDCFTERDVRVFKSYVAFCGIGLHNAQIYRRSRMEAHRNQVLLELARIVFRGHSDISHLIYTVLSHTVSLLQCQRAQLLLVGEDESPEETAATNSKRFSHAFNLAWNDDLDSFHFTLAMNSLENSRLPLQLEIAMKVVRTGEPINLPNAHSDPLFDAASELTVDPIWRAQSLLCMPIKHSDGRVLAVCFVVNKCAKDWRFPDQPESYDPAISYGTRLGFRPSPSDWSSAFSHADECLFEAFALFAGLGLANRQMYDRVMRLVAKQRILLDVLSYHATAPKSEAACLANSLIPSTRFYYLDRFSFTDIRMSDEATLKACVRMFLDLNFVSIFKLDMLRLCRWILSVKKNYREVTYHNWRHAFTVAQTMFAVLLNADLNSLFTDLECLALMVACLSHDLDHRGTDNQFQVKTMSPLVQLYSTSVLEHHHFNQCMMLLSRKGNDFLSVLNKSDYNYLVSLIKEYILATDLSRHFARLPDFNRTLEQREVSAVGPKFPSSMEPWLSNPEERLLLGDMLMTSCDISAITKPWPVQKITAELVSSEFFEQGDLEKDKLCSQPRELMDRSHMHELPRLQVEFIDFVCTPIYKAIVRVSSALQPLLDGCMRNRACWSYMVEGREVPESLFGLEEVDSTNGSGAVLNRSHGISPVSTHMGSINPNRIRQIVNAKPFESTPTVRRESILAATTVGGDIPDSPSSTHSSPPSVT